MEKKLTEAFDAVHMDDRCAERIETAIKNQNRSTRRHSLHPFRLALSAACLVLVMVVALNSTVAKAVDLTVTEAIEKIRASFQRIPGTVVVDEDIR